MTDGNRHHLDISPRRQGARKDQKNAQKDQPAARAISIEACSENMDRGDMTLTRWRAAAQGGVAADTCVDFGNGEFRELRREIAALILSEQRQVISISFCAGRGPTSAGVFGTRQAPEDRFSPTCGPAGHVRKKPDALWLCAELANGRSAGRPPER
ncbi:MAG: hypothetical protein AB7F35_31495 [Acetobacteraceae bacterium]